MKCVYEGVCTLGLGSTMVVESPPYTDSCNQFNTQQQRETNNINQSDDIKKWSKHSLCPEDYQRFQEEHKYILR